MIPDPFHDPANVEALWRALHMIAHALATGERPALTAREHLLVQHADTRRAAVVVMAGQLVEISRLEIDVLDSTGVRTAATP